MSDYVPGRFRDRRALRRAAVLLGVLLALALVVGGGTLLHAQTARPRATTSAVVGRTSTVCTVGSGQVDAGPTASPTPGPGASPSPSPTPTGGTDDPDAASTVSAVSVRQGTTGEGSLTGALLGSSTPDLDVTEPGSGAQLPRATAPVVLTGEGSMATAGSGVVSSNATTGDTTGLMAAPCLLPGTEQWFVGVGSTDDDRTELVLTNPDDAQATVDLRFYGPDGRVVVPGSPGVVVGGRSSRIVSVSALVDAPGPLSVAVRSSEGRVSVAARRLRTVDLTPAGADWQVPSAAPATTVVVPGIPGGAGGRSLEVVNPGAERAFVTVDVLGLTGAFAPAGADTVEVAPDSTTSVGLEAALAGESASVRLTSSSPVSASVVSASDRADAAPDLAVQSAQPALVRQGVSALATSTTGTASELVLSNAADTDAAVRFTVVSYAGVTLREDDILLAAGGSATRRITSPGPSYVVVSVPDGSSVVGSVTLTLPDGDVAGLATVPLTSPDVASRAPSVEPDPAVAR